jgi:hypothetical protein
MPDGTKREFDAHVGQQSDRLHRQGKTRHRGLWTVTARMQTTLNDVLEVTTKPIILRWRHRRADLSTFIFTVQNAGAAWGVGRDHRGQDRHEAKLAFRD